METITKKEGPRPRPRHDPFRRPPTSCAMSPCSPCCLMSHSPVEIPRDAIARCMHRRKYNYVVLLRLTTPLPLPIHPASTALTQNTNNPFVRPWAPIEPSPAALPSSHQSSRLLSQRCSPQASSPHLHTIPSSPQPDTIKTCLVTSQPSPKTQSTK